MIVDTKIDPNLLRALNDPVNVEKLDSLVIAMKKHGWRGRSLLVIETDSEYVAWTGSHRIAAAIEAGLATVPCYLLSESVFENDEFLAGCRSMSNAERTEIIGKTRDCRAYELMEMER